jgi:hypothetical protein
VNLVCDAQVRGRTVVQLLAVCALFGGGITWRAMVPAAKLVADEPLDQLRRETARLRVFDDEAASRARVALAAMRERLWTSERLEEWRRSLPGQWVLQEAQPQENSSTITRRFVLTRRAASSRDWNEIHTLLTAVNALPMAVVQRLKLSMMQPQSRQFDEIELILDLWFRKERAPEHSIKPS